MFYYLESDGQVFLVAKGRTWNFPQDPKQIPVPFEPLFDIPLPEGIVSYCKPELDHHPVHWFHKDELIGRPDVAAVVQKAVNRTLPRAAAKVAIVEKGKVLMVKAARGITKGYWNIPGGFVGYGEHPEESAVREVLEETGLRVRLKRLIGIYREVFPGTGGYMISFVYLGVRQSKTLRPHPEEIADITWMPLRRAVATTRNPFAKAGLRDYLRQRR